MELKQWLNSINLVKNDLMEEDPDNIRQFSPFIINKCMSGHIDTVMIANEMNLNHGLDKDMQYKFYLNSVRKRKRYSPWLRKDKVKDLDVVKSYYGYSNEKAQQALRILSPEQIDYIKSKLETGGKK
tara:strand:+ start:510 stop:890 length:381 start_codon:yes stop_codon:yes gene_type:complete